jgi:hypothetical protein
MSNISFIPPHSQECTLPTKPFPSKAQPWAFPPPQHDNPAWLLTTKLNLLLMHQSMHRTVMRIIVTNLIPLTVSLFYLPLTLLVNMQIYFLIRDPLYINTSAPKARDGPTTTKCLLHTFHLLEFLPLITLFSLSPQDRPLDYPLSSRLPDLKALQCF